MATSFASFADKQYGAEDDSTSFYSSVPSQVPVRVPAVAPSRPAAHDGQHSSDLSLALEDLSLDNTTSNHIHATVRNGYEEDFEGYAEDIVEEVNVEHACRCVYTKRRVDKR